MSINWYPGHMAKTRRLMLGDIKNIDMIVEVRDARIPESSKNPDLIELAAGKKRMLVLNREDQADQTIPPFFLYYASYRFPTRSLTKFPPRFFSPPWRAFLFIV